ncbi:hypothetical protein VB715_15785 [Crocosphaera sp. UHCC 0190]|uniref:hypothetical protein n=1 Tax=Crocosphaera sp. UHCC 0190 TaxID=3110246 RepID=UPI002B2180FF|nr:hypothetical protein [Crocosphaera sp. UHCC 0190]MEA5511234.1 hypothetical protein [Crocosphaera sp. UHCC 0190]
MFLTSGKVFVILRNYLILALFVMFISWGLTDVFTNPNRLKQQQYLDHYGRYFNAGLVNILPRLLR